MLTQTHTLRQRERERDRQTDMYRETDVRACVFVCIRNFNPSLNLCVSFFLFTLYVYIYVCVCVCVKREREREINKILQRDTKKEKERCIYRN
jgi:hypothetical protein